MSEWISVDKQLPKPSHDEIVLWNGRWAYVGKYLSKIHGGGEFQNPHESPIRGITHWMPLPEPPK